MVHFFLGEECVCCPIALPGFTYLNPKLSGSQAEDAANQMRFHLTQARQLVMLRLIFTTESFKVNAVNGMREILCVFSVCGLKITATKLEGKIGLVLLPVNRRVHTSE